MAEQKISVNIGAHIVNFLTKMQRIDRKLKQVSRKFKKFGKTMSRSVSLPIAALGGLAVRSFARLEQSMAKVQAVSGATGKELKVLSNLSKALGISTRFTAQEVAELELVYSKLGFSVDEITKVTAATLDLSLATGEDLAESATVAGSALRGFNLDASEMGRVTDVMAKAFSSSALDLEKYKISVGKIAPVMAAMNVSIERAAAMQSVLADSGVEASTVGTSLRKIFATLAKTGMSYEDALKAINGSTNKVKTAQALFGDRAFATAIILANSREEVDKLTESYKDSGGAAKAMALLMDDTLNGSLLRLRSAVEGMAIEFGETLKPAVEAVAKVMAKLAMKFAGLSDRAKKNIVVIATLAAALGPLIFLIGTLTAAIGFLMANPVVLTVVAWTTAIAVLAAAIIWVVKNWDNLVDEMRGDKLKNNLVDLGKFIAKVLTLPFELILKGINKILKRFKIRTIKFGIFDTIEEQFDRMKVKVGESKTQWIGFGKILDDVKKKFGLLGDDMPTGDGVRRRPRLGGMKSRGISPTAFDSKNMGTAISFATGMLDKGFIAAGKYQEGIRDIASVFIETAQVINESVRGLIEGTFVGFGTAIGEALVGVSDSFKSFGQGLLANMANFMQDLGKMLIQIGVAEVALNILLKTAGTGIGAVAAIAAGVGLVALGAGIKAKMSGGPQEFFRGGIVTGMGGKDNVPAMLTPGELILSKSQQKNLAGGIGGVAVMDTRINGNDLIISQLRTARSKGRIR